jgi:O-antigen ligase
VSAWAVVAGWTFVLYAAALPVAIAPMNVAGGLCVAFTLLAMVGASGPRWVRTPIDVPALAWLAAMVLATLVAIDRGVPVGSLARGLIPGVTAVAAWHARDRRRAAVAIAVLLAAGSVAGLIGGWRFFAQGGRFPARAIGFSGTWMTFGLQMSLLVSLAAGILISARERRWRVGALAAGLAGSLALALSFTRSAWLALAASLAVMLGLRRPWALTLLAAVGLVAVVALPGDLGDRLRSALDPGHPANRERTLMWQAGARLFLDHPVTGVGLQDLRPLLEPYQSPRAVERHPHLHNSYLQVAVSTGCIGFLAFLALCVALIRSAAGGPPGLRHARGLGAGVKLGVTAGTAGFMMGALFDHAFGDEPLLFLLFTLAGIAWAARGWNDSEAPPTATGAVGPGPVTRTS